MGLSSLTRTSKVTPELTCFVGKNGAAKPASSGWQGLSKDDCTIEWFYYQLDNGMHNFVAFRRTIGLYSNSNTVPTNSVTLFGLNTKFPSKPTSIWSFRRPPAGSVPTGGVLGPADAFALVLYASNVLPVAGLTRG